jgi:hypothetical protein
MEATMNVRNLERVTEVKCKTYEEAVRAKSNATRQPVHKIKIFARYDGTYDVVWYKKIETPGQKVIKALEEAVEALKPVVHGQKSKERKKSPKKAR